MNDTPDSKPEAEHKLDKKSGYVAIAGRPNSGKSTLLNAILGQELSIVTPKAQTTRERVLGILTEEPGQIVFIDTPGIHKAQEGGINHYMIQEVKSALEGVDVIWYILDPLVPHELETKVIEVIREVKAPILILLNKMDILTTAAYRTRSQGLLEHVKAGLDGCNVLGTFEISAKNKLFIKELLETTWRHIPHGPFFFDDTEQLSDRPLRFFVAEKIREQLLLQLGDEIPYSAAVRITEFKETTKPIRIEAEILIERESQKGIVIGAQARKIKSIGEKSRVQIEALIGAKIFLGLKVKVLKNWTENPGLMKNLGYELSTRKSR